MTNKQVINKLVETNHPHYQITKAIEELSELQTALLQYHNKNGKKTKKEDVEDELGDVEIRMRILKKIFSKKAVKDRVNFKLKKFAGYLKDDKYIGKI